MEEVTVTDIDNDGVLTVNDALYAAHESAFPDGASKGYGYYNHKDYGLSLGKLWGDSSGNFGYYLNNKSCWSLADTVRSGDCLNAFVYSDSKYFSDKYCYFSASEISADINSDIVLTLNSAVYDILSEICKENNILFSPVGFGELVYIEGIGNIYEMDFGKSSGWLYFVNNECPAVGCGNYILTDGDLIEWRYTLNPYADLDNTPKR